MEIIKEFPQILELNIEKKIEPKLNFYENKGYSRDYIIKRYRLFSYSLEKRIKPRFAYLDYLGTKESNLAKILYPNDKDFSKKYFKNGKKDYLEFLKKYEPYKNYKKKENRERD